MKYDVLVFIGRFNPFHVEHKRVIDTALTLAKNVIVLVGSANSPRTARNPFTFKEREAYIRQCFPHPYAGMGSSMGPQRVHILPLPDILYNDTAWIAQVQSLVRDKAIALATPDINTRLFNPVGLNDLKIGLIGTAKDHTGYFLKLFPQWDSVDAGYHTDMHATNIRESFFDGRLKRHEVYGSVLPGPVADFLFTHKTEDPDSGEITHYGFEDTNQFKELKAELDFIRNYKKSWEVAPYPPKFVTVDIVLEQSGHILLIRRRAAPGKGLWALPGGHLEMDETLLNGAIRELKEESKIKVPKAVLIGNIVNERVFDAVNRSLIGRVITYAYHIKLPDGPLPRVAGSDDADKAKWIPISEIRESQLFDDHYHIIKYFTGA